MKNLIQEKADVLTLTAPAGGVTTGLGYLIGGIFGVAITTVDAAEDFAARVRGVVQLVKAAGLAWTQGQAIYWDDTASNATINPEGNTFIGHATSTAASAAVVGNVNLIASNIGGSGQGVVGVSLTAPAGGVVAGTAYLIGDILALAMETVAATNPFIARIEGVIEHAKAAVAISEGERIYWDNDNSVLTNLVTGNFFVGVAVADALIGDANATINLYGVIQDASQGIVSLTAPVGDTVKGMAYLIGTLLAVAMESVVAGSPCRFRVGGPAILPILTTDTPAEGAALYWDDTNKWLTTTAGIHELHAVALEAKASGPATILALTSGASGTYT